MMIKKNSIFLLLPALLFCNFLFAQKKITGKNGFYKKEMIALQTAF